jgi:hypothetical protein
MQRWLWGSVNVDLVNEILWPVTMTVNLFGLAEQPASGTQDPGQDYGRLL